MRKTSRYQMQKEDKELDAYIQYREASDNVLMDILKHSTDFIDLKVAVMLATVRGDDVFYQLAVDLCEDQRYQKRAMGADILGQIANISEDKEIFAFDLLHQLVMRDKSSSVRSSAICSMGHQCSRNKVFAEQLIETCFHIINDAAVYVRQGTAFALSCIDDDRTIPLLVQLCHDTHNTVKDWAAFAVNCHKYDVPELRDVFAELLFSQDSEIKREAVIGLGRWQDARVIPILTEALKGETVYDDFIEAAGNLGDPQFLPTLEGFLELYDDGDGLIQNAINQIKNIH